MNRRVLATVAVLALVVSSLANAAITKKVQKAFRGQILITEEPLPDLDGSDADTIKKYKSLRLKRLKHDTEEGAKVWMFNYTAFMNRAPKGVSKLSFDFYTDDKEKLYVANKSITGFNPSLAILSGHISIGENDNLNSKRNYIVKLTGRLRGREHTFATTKVSTD